MDLVTLCVIMVGLPLVGLADGIGWLFDHPLAVFLVFGALCFGALRCGEARR